MNKKKQTLALYLENDALFEYYRNYDFIFVYDDDMIETDEDNMYYGGKYVKTINIIEDGWDGYFYHKKYKVGGSLWSITFVYE